MTERKPMQSEYVQYLDERCSRCGAQRREHAEVVRSPHDDEPEMLICPGSTFSVDATIFRLAGSPIPQPGMTFEVTLPKPCLEAALSLLDKISFADGTDERRKLKEAQSALHELRRML
jgi:hypothetical protein